MSKKKMFLNIIIIVLMLVAVYIGKDIVFSSDKIKEDLTKEDDKKPEEQKPVKKLQILDFDSNDRPIAVMIDNVNGAWPQAGLNEAYLIYEIIVEGGQTRLLALFKDRNTAKIGPVRSSRHYFLDYAMENDALYAHFGRSPQANRDISAFSIKNLDGMTNAGGAYTRQSDANHYAPHNVFASISALKSNATRLNYSITTNKKPILNYSVDEINLESEENAIIANNIDIRYSNYYTTNYKYDIETKKYNRFINNNPHMEMTNQEQYKIKNIIIINVKNYLDPYNSTGGRQTLDNVGSGNGYFVTNGYSIPITWEKPSRESKTVYKKLNGDEITLNDGNTYVQIQPITETSKFE